MTTAILMSAWNDKLAVRPTASRLANPSGSSCAIFIPRKSMTQKSWQRTLVEQPNAILAFAQKLSEEKYYCKFHKFDGLTYVGSQPKPSPRAPAHHTQTWNVKQNEHQYRDDDERKHQSAQSAQ